jgi:hypothetical protein
VSIWSIVYSALDPLNLPLAAGVYIPDSGESLPDEYLVYTLISSPPELHADNVETLRSYLVQVSYYGRTLINVPDIAGVMTAAGFTRGEERQIAFNQTTRHHGLAMDFNYLED